MPLVEEEVVMEVVVVKGEGAGTVEVALVEAWVEVRVVVGVVGVVVVGMVVVGVVVVVMEVGALVVVEMVGVWGAGGVGELEGAMAAAA